MKAPDEVYIPDEWKLLLEHGDRSRKDGYGFWLINGKLSGVDCFCRMPENATGVKFWKY